MDARSSALEHRRQPRQTPHRFAIAETALASRLDEGGLVVVVSPAPRARGGCSLPHGVPSPCPNCPAITRDRANAPRHHAKRPWIVPRKRPTMIGGRPRK